MIIETSANQFFRVTETGDVNLSHVWNGVEVKKVKGTFVDKKNSRSVLVRKEATRVVEA